MEAVADPVSQTGTKRQYRTAAERRRIVEETLVPGVSVATVARAHGVNTNQVFGWRKLYQSGLLGPLTTKADASAVRLLPIPGQSNRRALALEHRPPLRPIEITHLSTSRVHILCKWARPLSNTNSFSSSRRCSGHAYDNVVKMKLRVSRQMSWRKM